MGAFLYLDFTLSGAPLRWLSAKSDQFRKWAAAVNSQPGPNQLPLLATNGDPHLLFFVFYNYNQPIATDADKCKFFSLRFLTIISLPILLFNFWDLPFLRGIKIDLIMIWWTAVGTLFEYYWKRFCICPKATHVNYVRSVDVNIEWELGDSANLSDDKTQFYLFFHQLRLIHTYMILWKR